MCNYVCYKQCFYFYIHHVRTQCWKVIKVNNWRSLGQREMHRETRIGFVERCRWTICGCKYLVNKSYPSKTNSIRGAFSSIRLKSLKLFRTISHANYYTTSYSRPLTIHYHYHYYYLLQRGDRRVPSCERIQQFAGVNVPQLKSSLSTTKQHEVLETLWMHQCRDVEQPRVTLHLSPFHWHTQTYTQLHTSTTKQLRPCGCISRHTQTNFTLADISVKLATETGAINLPPVFSRQLHLSRKEQRWFYRVKIKVLDEHKRSVHNKFIGNSIFY